ncbi:MAG: HNH endonuclease [Oligoflexia bacterium]|nr:HNH endonuclease [Oligoflexia bacterium]
MSGYEDQVEPATPIIDFVGVLARTILSANPTLTRADHGLTQRIRALTLALARGSGALDLRLARLTCHIQQMDLRPLGYGSFSSFVREALDWQPSRQRELARLLRSDLNLIKHAVAFGLVPVSTAARAPGRVSVDQQQEWLDLVLGIDTDASLASPDDELFNQRREVWGDDATTVRRARVLMRLLLGFRAPARICDQWTVDAWARQMSSAELIDLAHQSPVAPDLSLPTWFDDIGDADTELLGPFRAPRDLSDALALVQQVQAVRRHRRGMLGCLLERIHAAWDGPDWDWPRFDDYVRQELGLSVRSVQRLRQLGRALEQNPALVQAIDGGLSGARVDVVLDLARTGEQVRRWIAIAQRMPLRELQDAAHTVPAGHAEDLASSYEQRLSRAETLVADAMAKRRLEDNSGSAPKTGGGLGPTLGSLDPDQIRVAKQPLNPELRATTQQGNVRVNAKVVVASRWLLDTVHIPRQRGVGQIKERQHYICQNPECHRRSLRNHTHHDIEQAMGGTDDEWNLRCLCPSCHLRLRHGGFMDIVRIGDAHVYLYPGRAVVVT